MKTAWKAAALGAALGVAAFPALGIPLPGNAGWQNFLWADLGPIDNPADGFQLVVPAGRQANIRVVDRLIIGDRFEVFVDGISQLVTSPIGANDNVQTNITDGDLAWANGDLSKGGFTLGPGTYEIDIDVVRTTALISSGGAFIRADIPEPATPALLGLGLAGLAALPRRRARSS